MTDYKIRILHLFPDLLNLYGDKGNIETLRRRLTLRGIEAEVITLTSSTENIDISGADIIFIGGGSDREQKAVCDRLLSKQQELKNYAEDNGVLIAVCGAYPMLGKYFQIQGEKAEGLGILDIYTDSKDDRLIGNVVLETSLFSQKITGFENHAGRTCIGSHSPLGKVLAGNGSDGKSGLEGVVYKNVIGTYLHGPLLPKNPQLCDYILSCALKRKYPYFEGLSPLDDTLENQANEYIVSQYTKEN